MKTLLPCLLAIPGSRVAAAVLALVFFATTPARAGLELQPGDKHSTLISHGGVAILDYDFASIIQSALITNGVSNVKDAKFFFQECFGGGMLDDLSTALGSTVKWVGGAASRWDEFSWGPVSPTTQPDFWTSALLPEFAPPKDNLSLLAGIYNAILNDPAAPGAGIFQNAIEHGQSIFANGGDTITLKDPGATSHHAILWAGETAGADRFANDINLVRDALLASWGPLGPNTTITILFGDGTGVAGAQAANRSNLIAALGALNLGPDEEFLFYASDHGGLQTDIMPRFGPPIKVPKPPIVPPVVPPVVPPGHIEPFNFTPDELLAMQLGGTGLQTLTVRYQGVFGSNNEVLVNGHLLGTLNPAATETVFNVSLSDLGLANEVEIRNGQGVDFDLLAKIFDNGGIPAGGNPIRVVTPVPEPSTWAGGVALLGVAVFRLIRRKRR